MRLSEKAGIITGTMTLSFRHIGFTVSNIQRSIEFYQGILGLQLKEGPRDVGGKGSTTPIYTGLPDAHLRVASLQLYQGTSLELIQYLAPQGGKTVDTRRCDTGSAHICFTVDNLPKMYETLKSKGVRTVSEPMKDSKGNLMFYFYDPDGFTLEITSAK
jgi:glyoxylase I family protein